MRIEKGMQMMSSVNHSRRGLMRLNIRIGREQSSHDSRVRPDKDEQPNGMDAVLLLL